MVDVKLFVDFVAGDVVEILKFIFMLRFERDGLFGNDMLSTCIFLRIRVICNYRYSITYFPYFSYFSVNSMLYFSFLLTATHKGHIITFFQRIYSFELSKHKLDHR